MDLLHGLIILSALRVFGGFAANYERVNNKLKKKILARRVKFS